MLNQNLKLLNEFSKNLYETVKDIEVTLNYELTGKTLKVEGKTLFSKYNPQREAEQIFNKQAVKRGKEKNIHIIGVANPFLIKKFIEESYNVEIFIPNAEIFKLILSFFDYSRIIKNAKFLTDLSLLPVNTEYVFATKFEENLFKKSIKSKSLMNSPKKSTIKILLVKPIYGGSLPVANYCELNFNESNVKLKTIDSDKCYSAFQMIPETLLKKENISRIRAFLADFISEITICAIEEFKPDIIFALAQAPLNEKVLKYASDKGIVKAFWFVEDWKLFTYWKYFAPFYDYFFVIQKNGFFRELQNIGVKNSHYLPLACEPTIHKPLELNENDKKRYGSVISFVGAGYYNRRKFFRKFLDYDFKIWGSDWEGETILSSIVSEHGRRVSTEECVKIFNASLININLHSSTYYEGIDPEGDFVNPRTFEIAACNSYQLVDKRKYIPMHFKENEEIITYSSETELKSYINKIINSPEIYQEIREASYKRVLKEHTYFHRLCEAAKIMGFNIERKKENIANEKDFYLSEFNSIEEIASYIEKKDKVSDTDTIFLLMKALKDTYLK